MNRVTGSEAPALQLYLEEFFNPGQPVELLVGLPRDLTEDELSSVATHLKSSGVRLIGRLEIGTAAWPSTLRLRFRRPARVRAEETGVLPFAVLLIAALGAVGVGAILGWSLSEVFRSLARNLLPITIIVTGGFVAVAYLKGREGLTTAR